PIRRIVPPVGLFDLSPVVAYLVLVLLQAFVDRVIFR
ncbi:MAG: YggT family protein, partial [Gemmatimonadales bacterium]|nr:YggT family protein [Gemmatimonadales bacterium]